MGDLVEVCSKQINNPVGYFPMMSLLKGNCKDCAYDPVNNSKCPCYSPKMYESENLENLAS
jgi:hypothetical protein